MVNFQTFKLISVIMLLVGICINNEAKISFIVAPGEEENAQRTALKKLLINGFLQHLEDNQDSLKFAESFFILANLDYKFENDSDPHIKNLHEKDDFISSENTIFDITSKVKTKLSNIKTDAFELNVTIEHTNQYSSNKIGKKEKTLILESINITNKKALIIGNELHLPQDANVNLYDDLLKGFKYEEMYDFSDEDLQKLEKSVSISLNIASLDNITPIFNQPKLLIV